MSTDKFRLYVIGMLAWILSDTITILLRLARQFDPGSISTILMHIVGIPMGLTFSVWGYLSFYRGWKAGQEPRDNG